jgi:hypothetical protein
MSRMVRRGEVTVNRVGPFRCAAILVAVLGGLLAVPPSPAHADLFDRTLFVAGRTGTVEVVKRAAGRGVPLEWNFPFTTPGSVPHWEIRVGTRPITCTADDSASRVPGTWFFPISLERSGSRDLDTSGPDFHEGAYYYVRGCLALDRGRHHGTNQVEIRMIAPPRSGDFIPAPLPGTPLITGFFGREPVRPGHWIGVTGRAFGERPGRLLLRIGAAEYRLNVSDGDWHSRLIVGQLDRSISGVRDDDRASVIVEHAGGARGISSRIILFRATREVRFVPGGEVYTDRCSQEADDNGCGPAAYPGAPSFEGKHSSLFVWDAAGETGTDQFSVTLANGWRFHELEWSHGLDEDRPRWTIRGRETDHPSFDVVWHNAGGHGIFYYGFRLYIVGPVGVPHR